MKVAKQPMRRTICLVAVRNSTMLSAASSASRAAKVHSTCPGPHSFSIERSGSSIASNASASADIAGCIRSMLDSEW